MTFNNVFRKVRPPYLLTMYSEKECFSKYLNVRSKGGLEGELPDPLGKQEMSNSCIPLSIHCSNKSNLSL